MELLDKRFVDGRREAVHGTQAYTLVNPAAEQAYGELRCADQTDADVAVSAAARALHGPWRTTSVAERIAAQNATLSADRSVSRRERRAR